MKDIFFRNICHVTFHLDNVHLWMHLAKKVNACIHTCSCKGAS